MSITPEQAEAGRAIRSMVFTAGFWPRVVNDASQRPYAGTPFSERGSEKSRFVFAEGVNVLSKEPVFNNPWKLAGNRVWYKFATPDIHEKHEQVQKYFNLDNKAVSDQEAENIRKFLGNDNEAMQMMGVTMGQGFDDISTSGQQVVKYFREKEFFLKAFNTFKSNNAKYTGTYLSELMSQLRKDLRTSGSMQPKGVPASGHAAKGQKKGRYSGYTQTLSKTAGALMREEQTRVVEGGRAADTSGLIGMTQPIDATYANMMGRVHIDVSEMRVSEGGHHGLSAGAIMSEQEAQDLAGGEHFEEIKERVFDYYQERIGEWNQGISAIRERAKKISGKKTVSAGAMRRAGFGAGAKVMSAGKATSGIPKHKGANPSKFGKPGKQRPALSYGKGGRATKQKLLRNASVSAKTVAQQVFSTLGTANLNKTAAQFIMHGLGTWNQHNGRYYHGLTVTKDPHVTTSILFRMFGRNAQRAYEYKNLRENNDVMVHYGFASLAILDKLGRFNSQNYLQTVQDMSDVHLSTRYVKNVNDIVKNTVMAQGARSGKGFKMTQRITAGDGERFEMETHGGVASTAIYIPSGWTKDVIGRTMEIFEGRFNSTGANRAGFRAKAKSAAKPFQAKMREFEDTAATRFDVPVYWPKVADFWASPYYGVGYEPPLE
jgi:hypothetical protein